jgi:hypothetical protein
LPVVKRPEGMLYFADVRLDEASLAAILAAVAEHAGEEARFEELTAPAPPAEPVLTLDAVVWWAQPASGWSPWGRIPIAVEPAPPTPDP